MLAAAEPYFWEFAVKVWRTEVAHSERYEFLIYRVRRYSPRAYAQAANCCEL